MSRKWTALQSVVELEKDGKYYCLHVIHSGHDFPPVITSDPDTSEPPEFDIWIDNIPRGYCDGEDMTKEQIADFWEENEDAIIDEILSDY